MLSSLRNEPESPLQRAPARSGPWTRRVRQWFVGRTSKPAAPGGTQKPLPRRGVHRVLVCRVSHTLGNTLLVTPLIREIERVFPGAEIDIVTRSTAADAIFGRFDRVRTVFALPGHGFSSPHRVASVLHALRTRAYDLAIDPGLLSATDRMYVQVANATWKIGYASKPAGALTHAIAAPADLRHVAKLPVYLLREALNEAHDETYPALGIALSDAERSWGRAMLDEIAGGHGPVVALFTAATGGKHLGADWWQAFAAHCATSMPDARIVEIVPLAGSSVLDNRWPTYYSTDLRRLAAVLSAASRFVAADCGVMHLACAANAPTVGLFRGTSIPEWGPYGARDLALDVTALSPFAVAGALSAFDDGAVAAALS